MNEEWVKREGVEGFPPPDAPREQKYPLSTFKIYSHMGRTISDSFPKTSKTSVGPDCLGCLTHRPGLDWYYHPQHPLFSTAGQSRVRPKKADGTYDNTKTGWYHNGAMCPSVWKDTHQWVRKRPEDKWMFDRVPQGENAFARPEGH